jgi:MoxR-like ATPase
MKVPGVPDTLSYQVVSAVQRLRQADLFKPPGVAETLDWARALLAMDRQSLDEQTVNDTLGVLLKYHDDVQGVQETMVKELIGKRAIHDTG